MNFSIQTLSHGELKVWQDLPPGFPGPRLPGGVVMSAWDKFGNFCIQEFYGGAFTIRLLAFDILEDFTITIQSLFSGLHTSIMRSNSLEVSIKEAGTVQLEEGEFIMVQGNQPASTITFRAQQRYEIFEALYESSIVADTLSDLPAESTWLLRKSSVPALLVNPAMKTDIETRENIEYILDFAEDKKWRRSYFESHVRDILLQLTMLLMNDTKSMPLTENEKRIAYLAQQLILKDLSKHITIPALAKKVNTSETTLKRVFKRVFGKTLLKYREYYRLKAAFKMINQQGLSVKETAALTGWSASYLIKMYNKKFNTTPGSAR